MSIRRLFRRTAAQGRSRVLVKTVVYRVLMVVVTILVALAVTGRVEQAIQVGIWANLLKMGIYYGYERVWDHVDWGLVEG